MDDIPPCNDKIALVDGLNGYIGSFVGLQMLEDGYKLRGVVRRQESAKPLLDGPYKAYLDAGRVEIVEIPDMTLPGAYDEAVKGVDNIQHIASPARLVGTVDDFLQPAVRGCVGVLESAKAHAGPQLRVVTITSSVAAVVNPEENRQFTPKDWNPSAAKVLAELGDEAPFYAKYANSKVKAERAFWDFKEQEKPSFAMAAVHPTLTMGPILFVPAKEDQLGESIKIVLDLWRGGEIKPSFTAGSAIDVRDVARMHAYTAKHPRWVDGKRFLMSNGVMGPQAIADVLRDAYQDKRKIDVGQPGVGYTPITYDALPDVRHFDNSLPKEALCDLIGLKKTVLDAAKHFEKFGL